MPVLRDTEDKTRQLAQEAQRLDFHEDTREWAQRIQKEACQADHRARVRYTHLSHVRRGKEIHEDTREWAQRRQKEACQADHWARVRYTHLSHVRRGKEIQSTTKHTNQDHKCNIVALKSRALINIDNIQNLRKKLLLELGGLQQGRIDYWRLDDNQQTALSACVTGIPLSFDLVETLMQDASAFDDYCETHITLGHFHCNDMQNKLNRIAQGREVIAKMYIRDEDFTSDKHAEILRQMEKVCQSNGHLLVTVKGQLEPDADYVGLYASINCLMRKEIDRFYESHGYQRVESNVFSCKNAEQQSYAVYCKELKIQVHALREQVYTPYVYTVEC